MSREEFIFYFVSGAGLRGLCVWGYVTKSVLFTYPTNNYFMIKMNSRKEMPEPIVITQTGDKSGLELSNGSGTGKNRFQRYYKGWIDVT